MSFYFSGLAVVESISFNRERNFLFSFSSAAMRSLNASQSVHSRSDFLVFLTVALLEVFIKPSSPVFCTENRPRFSQFPSASSPVAVPLVLSDTMSMEPEPAFDCLRLVGTFLGLSSASSPLSAVSFFLMRRDVLLPVVSSSSSSSTPLSAPLLLASFFFDLRGLLTSSSSSPPLSPLSFFFDLRGLSASSSSAPLSAPLVSFFFVLRELLPVSSPSSLLLSLPASLVSFFFFFFLLSPSSSEPKSHGSTFNWSAKSSSGTLLRDDVSSS
mmetsp:Transcript_19568/g.33637  ORF Transcript_19568/g.33637 Transcript_19568/m.33637 type:complete len:270 (+) Transcript_19568:22-831(+)